MTNAFQSNEVDNSNAMELEGLQRCLANLNQKNINIEELVTDRHVQVRAYMKREMRTIRHTFDVWHLAKSKWDYNK